MGGWKHSPLTTLIFLHALPASGISLSFPHRLWSADSRLVRKPPEEECLPVSPRANQAGTWCFVASGSTDASKQDGRSSQILSPGKPVCALLVWFKFCSPSPAAELSLSNWRAGCSLGIPCEIAYGIFWSDLRQEKITHRHLRDMRGELMNALCPLSSPTHTHWHALPELPAKKDKLLHQVSGCPARAAVPWLHLGSCRRK